MQTYRQTLEELVEKVTGETAINLPVADNPDWENDRTIPNSVEDKSKELGVPLSLSVEQWEMLSPIQRFVLIKLSRSSRKNRNFVPVLEEFKLV